MLELVKAATREVALDDKLMAAVLMSLLLEGDDVVVLETLVDVELDGGEMVLDEDGALETTPEVENEDRLLLVLEVEEEMVLEAELATGDKEMLVEVETMDKAAKVPTNAELLELDAKTVLVVTSVPRLDKVPDARLEVTVDPTADEVVAEEKTVVVARLTIRAAVEREVMVGTIPTAPIPEPNEYEMLDTPEVLDESSETVVAVELALLKLVTIVVVALFGVNPGVIDLLFRSKFAGSSA